MAINPANPVPTVFVLSDSIGETGEIVLRAAASQFEGLQLDIVRKPNLNSVTEVDQALQTAAQTGAVVVYTLVRADLQEYLQVRAEKLGVPCVDIMNPLISALASLTGLAPRREPGLIRKVDQAYFARVEAIEFAVKYDDGKEPLGLEKADLVIIGVSRTSKTPLCMYLAHKGIKAANVPLVIAAPPPDALFLLPAGKIIGLTIRPANLQEIRKQRLRHMGISADTDYVRMENIAAEYEYARSVMRKIGCTIIDVTNKSVEETAASVLEIYRKGVMKRG
jgi:regulator of PEP synthase PpsR (kinase-PPPase family)